MFMAAADSAIPCESDYTRSLRDLCEQVARQSNGSTFREEERRIRPLVEQNPRAALLALVSILDSPAEETLACTIRRAVRSIPSYGSYLCEPRNFSVARSLQLFRSLETGNAYVDVEVAQAAADLAKAGDTQSALVALSVLEELARSPRVLPILIPTLKAQDEHIRSKAAGVFARLCVNLERLKARMTDAEPRVRANII